MNTTVEVNISLAWQVLLATLPPLQSQFIIVEAVDACFGFSCLAFQDINIYLNRKHRPSKMLCGPDSQHSQRVKMFKNSHLNLFDLFRVHTWERAAEQFAQ